MKARIVENLMDVIDEYFDGSEGHRYDTEFKVFCDKFAGKELRR